MSIRTLAAGALLALLAATPAAAQDVTRDLTQIKGDVWRFQNNFHFSVLIVTAEGVVVTDPINNDAANWLEAEIATRFGKPRCESFGLPMKMRASNGVVLRDCSMSGKA